MAAVRWLGRTAMVALVLGCTTTPAATPTFPGGTSAPTAGSSTPSAADSTPSPTQATAPPAQLRWAKLELHLPASALVAASTGTPRTYVAITEPGSVWRSEGGNSWQRVAQLTFPEGDANAVTQLAYANGRYIAVGILGSSRGSSVTLAAYVAIGSVEWVSADGLTWKLVSPKGLAPDANVLDNLVLTSDRLLATTTYFGEAPAEVVSTRDGQTWSSEAPLRAPDVLSAKALTIFPDGTPVVLGSAENAETCAGEVVAEWLVEDHALQPVSMDEVCGRFEGVIAGPAGYVALQNRESEGAIAPVLVASQDGRHWADVATAFSQPRDPIGVTESGFFLVADDAGVWESRDGVTWATTIAMTGEPRPWFSFAGDVLLACGYTEGCDAYRLQP